MSEVNSHLECGREGRDDRSYRFRGPDGGLRTEYLLPPRKR